MRKLLGIVAVSVLAVAGASACTTTSSKKDSGGGGGNATLSVWSWRPEDAATYRQIFAKFEQSHKGIKIDFKPYKATDYNTILSTGLSQAGGPDVMQLRSYGLLQPLVNSSRLVPLDGKVSGLTNFDANALAGAKGKTDGKVYGVPLEMSTFQVYYNKDIFTKHNLQPPTSWDQMINDAKQLKADGITPFAATTCSARRGTAVRTSRRRC